MFFESALPNGLRIIGQKLPHYQSISLGVWIGTGSVKERDNEAGISHFIEHMLFKGTQRRSAQQIAAEMDGMGAQLNAFTSKECTCYYAKFMGSRLRQAADVLSDMVLHSAFDPEEMKKEKGVVTEEILMVEDSPEDLAMDLLSETFFGKSPLGTTWHAIMSRQICWWPLRATLTNRRSRTASMSSSAVPPNPFQWKIIRHRLPLPASVSA